MRDNNRLSRCDDHPCNVGIEYDGSLSDLLNLCGHYYAHRIGGSHRGQNSVLTWLAEHPDVTQKELAEGLGIMPASLSEVLMKLERKGYIDRFKDETDRRFIRVHLTEEGTAALDMLEEKGENPFSSLSSAEQETLKKLLSKLLSDWEARYMPERSRRNRRPFGDGRDVSLHGNEHPGHEKEHPGHGDEHPGHGRDERGSRFGREHGRDTDRRGHGNR